MIKYTSQSVTKTTVKMFDINGAAPNKASWAKKEFLPDRLEVTYTEGAEGLRRIRWTIRGPVLLKDGKTGVVRADADDWSSVPDSKDDFQSIAEKNAPWSAA